MANKLYKLTPNHPLTEQPLDYMSYFTNTLTDNQREYFFTLDLKIGK